MDDLEQAGPGCGAMDQAGVQAQEAQLQRYVRERAAARLAARPWFEALERRIRELTQSLKKRAPIYMAVDANNLLLWVGIGSRSPRFARASFLIGVGSGGGASKYSIYVARGPLAGATSTGQSAAAFPSSGTGCDIEQVMGALSAAVAVYVQHPLPYELPLWSRTIYNVGGTIVGIFAFFATWGAIAYYAGWWGALLGWIVAFPAGIIIGGLWPAWAAGLSIAYALGKI